ncbi:MAG: DUF2480 family protein [Cyclobacteriaceae bacterium]|nr:DUF2480 family protein [Cyclobacteriaceae bacterium]
MENPIVNKVASSPLITFDLEEFYHPGERIVFDIKDFLYEGLILREKEFRAKIREYDWAHFMGKNIALTCSVDVIIPSWAWMLIMIRLSPVAHMVVLGDLSALEGALFQQALGSLDVGEYRDKKVVIKGCGRFPVPDSAYVEITRLLTPVVSSLMYGEPCSTVPLYKNVNPAKGQG